MKKQFTLVAGILALLSIQIHGMPDEIEPEPKWYCCEKADIASGPAGAGCSASCAAGGVPLGSSACSEEGESQGPYVYPGGCFVATSEAECVNTTINENVALFYCRRSSCGGGRYACSWVPDGSEFPISVASCDGTPCFGS